MKAPPLHMKNKKIPDQSVGGFLFRERGEVGYRFQVSADSCEVSSTAR